ncbi:hypothetical protein SAMN05216456_1936 [Devosia crocina]|uniref:Uncharacterized protein n=1 Tax=Devosia crocina TaxID=429728 RepID=A0A1I7NF38_9HYPH|nr:hypothetical protein [Devosia crocina]SFV33259.1 hypothetical protein SAMN05216456_1936 [Devosia crocina]
MPATPLSRADALATLSLLSAEPPRSIAESLADVFVSNDQEGRVTVRPDLYRAGFSDEEIDAHQAEAVQIAGRRQRNASTRDVNTARQKSIEEITAEMAEAILANMPPDILLVSDLQGRGHSTRNIDFCLPRAKAIAATQFAQRAAGGLQ